MKRSASIFAFSPVASRKRRRNNRRGFIRSVRRAIELLLHWLQAQRSKRLTKSLRLSESVSLGEKRFAAVLEYGNQRFLVAGTAQSVSLLAELRAEVFSNVLMAQQSIPPKVD